VRGLIFLHRGVTSNLVTNPQDVHKSGDAGNVSPLQFTTQLPRLMPLGVAALGILLIGVGIFWEYFKTHQNPSSKNSSQKLVVGEEGMVASVAGVKNQVKGRTIFVDVSGAVEKPQVVEVPYDSRVKDVLIAAGGLTPKADRNYVSKSINLAQKVQDGTKIYVPAQGEMVSVSAPQVSGNSGQLGIQGNLININEASESELDSLPGVGPVTAQKIISGRPYQEVSELVSKKIVNQSVFDKIRDKVAAY